MTDTVQFSRVFSIVLSKKSRVEEALIAQNKKGARRGLPSLAFTWGRPVTAVEHVAHTSGGSFPEPVLEHRDQCVANGDQCMRPVTRIDLTLIGDVPKLAGWSFAATLQHLEGGTIIRAVSDVEIPAKYRSAGQACDHCKSNRNRNDTYILRHEDGRYQQVGSSCIGEVLGTDRAGVLCGMAEATANISAILSACKDEDGNWGEESEGGGFRREDYSLAEFLPYVSWAIRRAGWLSKTKAEASIERVEPTCDLAWKMLVDYRDRAKAGCEITPEDTAEALAVEAWGEAISDATLAGERSDYLSNLRVIARSGLANWRLRGLAASMTAAYQKAQSEAARASRAGSSAHVGTIGERLKGAQAELIAVAQCQGREVAYGVFVYPTWLTFRTMKGEVMKWKASSTDLDSTSIGKKFSVTGTVKAHDSFRGEAQTVITRAKLAPL